MERCAGVLLALAMLVHGASAQDRVIVIGVDGMDHELCRSFMAEGKLPALAALAAEGTFSPLIPTNPAQSPTSWATLTTGCNPGTTGIFGFLRRSIVGAEVIPELALAERTTEPGLTETFRTLTCVVVLGLACIPLLIMKRRRVAGLVLSAVIAVIIIVPLMLVFADLPHDIPAVRNLRSARSMWEAFDAEGVPGIYLDAPCAFPAPSLENGHLLCGLGVPDMLGTMGNVKVFRDGPVPGGARITPMGGSEIALRRSADGSELSGAWLDGPPSPLDGTRPKIEVSFKRMDPDGLNVRYQEVDSPLPMMKFSEFLPVHYRFGRFIDLRGLVRFRVMRGGERPLIYQEPIQFDPRSQVPTAPITSSAAFGRELAQEGPFETAGWATATNPYTDELIDDATVLEDIETVSARRHRLIGRMLVRARWRVFFAVVSTPDRVQHVFWRDRDPAHPAHDKAGAARRGDVILAAYQKVDDLIGRIRRNVMRPGDVLLVVSDHGFAPWRYSVNLNRWLAEKGYLSGRADGRRTLAAGVGKPVFRHVDWSRTRAYSLGLGRIWLNLEGREPAGIVKPSQVEPLLEEIRAGLLALNHEGRSVVRSVAKASGIYSGDRSQESADLIVGFERGYRVSWDSCLGGIDEELIAANLSRWSGDHCSVDPDLVPGVLFCSRAFPDGRATVTDIYPTIRALLGLAPQDGLDGRALWRPSR